MNIKIGKGAIFYVCLLFFVFIGCKKENIFKSYAKPELTVTATDSRLSQSIIHFSKDTVYILATNLIINPGQILKIDAGTLIKVNDALGIMINPGGRIEAIGTETQPIVFTSSAYKGTAGFLNYQNNQNEHSWVGITILGNYPATIDSTPAGTGIITFVRIEFAGGSFRNNNNQLPALSLQNVGRGTIIENVEVSYSVAYNSFQISGGNFNARNLVSYACGNSDFAIMDGYTGMLQNLLAYRHPYFAPQLGSGTSLAGLILTGGETFPTISNITVLGPDMQNGTNPKYFDITSPGPFGTVNGSRVAALIVSGSKFHIRNSLFMGFPKTGFYLDGYVSASSLLDSTSDFKYSVVECSDLNRGFYLSDNTFPPYTSHDFKDFMLQQNYFNQLFYDASQLALSNPFDYDKATNPFPQSTSLLISGANFDSPFFNNSFFEKVNYRGALGTINWLQGWSNVTPLQINYNN